MNNTSLTHKLVASMCAWAIAPGSVVIVLYVLLMLYLDRAHGYTEFTWNGIAPFFIISYAVSTVIGLPIHAGFVVAKMATIRNYTAAGTLIILLAFLYIQFSEGVPNKLPDLEILAVLAVFIVHGAATAACFGWIYNRLCEPESGLNRKPESMSYL